MAKCPHCEKELLLESRSPSEVQRETKGIIKKEVMYSCPHCDKVIGFSFFFGGLVTKRP